MAAMPAQVFFRAAGNEPKDWLIPFMSTGKIEADGSFDVETPDGPTKVNIGDAVFIFNGEAYVCPPKLMNDKLRSLAPDQVAAVATPPKQALPTPAPKSQAPKPLKFKPCVGSPPTPSNIKIDDMEVDDTYQRSIEGGKSQSLIQKIAINFDWRLCLPLLGSRRNGKIYIIDGQHRLEGARLRGDIPWMPVVVFDFDDPKAEAELFIEANRARRPMNGLDDFHAGIVAGDEKCLQINAVVEQAGLVVGRNPAWQHVKAGEVVFIRTLGTAIKRHGREIATLALGIIAEAFAGQVLNGASAIFDALCAIIADGEKTTSPIDAELMKVVLAEVGLKAWKDAIANVSEEGIEDRREAMQRELRKAYDEASAQ